MALVQSDRPRSLQPESGNSKHQPESRRLRVSSEAATPASSGPQPSRSSAPALTRYKGTVVAKRATCVINATDEEGCFVEIKYHVDTDKSLQALFDVHLSERPEEAGNFTAHNVVAKLEAIRPSQASIVKYFRGKIKTTHVAIENPRFSFPIRFLIKNHQLFLIKEICTTMKCEHCGRYFKGTHTCSARRRDFYFHHINAQSSSWWEPISFFPLGAPPETKRLYITYDVETYTWHGKFGKQLVPFMLVLHLSGDDELLADAITLIRQTSYIPWPKHDNTFYYLNPTKKTVGQLFKSLRNTLQTHFAKKLWQLFLDQNPKITEYCQLKQLDPDQLTADELKNMKIVGTPSFWEVYVVGHNINGFDEIVLAAQIISNKSDVPASFHITRNFMPRNGKILFNDITFGLPNPASKKRQDFTLWEQGGCEASDFKWQYVKFMVRDTFALTHTSLRKAAAAYALDVEKGSCPYKAVNEFYMFGSYQVDEVGFPDEHYWSSREEYLFNREEWLKKKEHAYDIITQTLEYCVMDVVVTAKLVQKLQTSYAAFVQESVNLPESSFNVFQRPTISSNSHAIFRQIVYRAEKPQKTHLGQCLLAPSNEMYDYVRSSIRGGRCYPSYIGLLSEPIYVYDICGMYASALTHPFPSGRPLNPFDRALAVKNWEMRLKNSQTIDYFTPHLLPGIFTIDADPPSETYLDVLPPFCSRKGGRLCWTNESLRGEVATSVDIITLHNRGWKVRIVTDERTTVFPEWKCIAQEYVKLNIAAKEKADKEKNQTIRSIAKLLSNALYGSFATKLDNKKTVFADQLDSSTAKGIANGEFSVKSSSFIETDCLSAEIMSELVVAYSPDTLLHPQQEGATEANTQETPTFIGPTDHVTYTYKPITFLEAEEDEICLQTIEKNSPLIPNDRYPSHIASFVLAWTRAFVSEWASFLYSEDLGTPMERRCLKSVYGDTDSLFLTEEGRRLMETKGKHRIKKNGGKLVFDPANPDLTWLVECETQCEKCGADAFSSQSIFLAPKLYALKDTTCPVCKHVGKGKLRAKGHATDGLSFEIMSKCYFADSQLGSDKFQTSRMSIKRTLASGQSHVQPFTVTETTLTRTLRPWKDKTMTALDQHRLIPYSNSCPNPRNNEVCWIEMSETM
ncbi:pol [Tree shrew adenovirus 1]|nr:pol [Tree shrew adenovirus 1]